MESSQFFFLLFPEDGDDDGDGIADQDEDFDFDGLTNAGLSL